MLKRQCVILLLVIIISSFMSLLVKSNANIPKDDEQEQIRHCNFWGTKHEIVCVVGSKDCTPVKCGQYDPH